MTGAWRGRNLGWVEFRAAFIELETQKRRGEGTGAKRNRVFSLLGEREGDTARIVNARRFAIPPFKKKKLFYNGFNTYATPGVAHNP